MGSCFGHFFAIASIGCALTAQEGSQVVKELSLLRWVVGDLSEIVHRGQFALCDPFRRFAGYTLNLSLHLLERHSAVINRSFEWPLSNWI